MYVLHCWQTSIPSGRKDATAVPEYCVAGQLQQANCSSTCSSFLNLVRFLMQGT